MKSIRQLFLLLWVLSLAAVLSACGGSGSSSDGGGKKTSSSAASSASSSSAVSEHVVTVTDALNTPSADLACNQPLAPASCNLRIYQIMVESFVDGDADANYNTGYGTSHHKGDIQGIIDSLDYIDSLGVNAIWLTPIFLSQPINGQDQWADRLDATGYFASNYFAVDPKFGTSEQLHELITEAHSRGLYVFMDGVFGHFKGNAHNFHSPSDITLSTTGPVQAGIGREAVYDQDLEFFKEVAAYWIAEYKIDGWRLDQAYQVPVQYWDDLREAVEDASAEVTYENENSEMVNPLGYMVAEIWRSNNEIASQGYGEADAPALNSAFDFPLRYSVVQTFAVQEDGDGKKAATQLNTGFATQLAYPAHAQPNLMLGNHDLVRFGDLLQRGSIANPTDEEYWLRHKAAFSFMAAFSGPVTIYYGDEVGQQLDGFAAKVEPCNAMIGNCDDHVSRTSAIIDGVATTVGGAVTVLNDEQADLKSYVTDLMSLRAEYPALYSGKRTHIFSGTNIYIDRKEHADGNMLYIANTKAQPAVITLASSAVGSEENLVNPVNNDVYVASGGNFTIELAPFEALFLTMGDVVDSGGGISDDELMGEGDLADCSRAVVDGLGPLGKQMYIRGSYSGGDNFGATPVSRRFNYTGDNIYQIKVNETAAASYTFKFASADWSSEFAVADEVPVAIASTQTMAVASGSGTESFIAIPKAGEYVFSFEINGSLNGGDMMVSLCPAPN